MGVQSDLDSFATDTPTETESVTRTVRCKLETSERKNTRLREVIDEWQSMAYRFAELLPTVSPFRWGDTQSAWQNRLVTKEFPTDEIGLRSHERNQALYKVSEAFGSWDVNGREGDTPQGEFGNSNYIRLCHCGVTIDENDRGYGVKLNLQPYKPEWFHIDAGAYQRECLQGIIDGDYDTGTAEVHLSENGTAYLHLTVSRDIDVYESPAVPRYIGVDIGERVIYAATVIEVTDDGNDDEIDREDISVNGATMERGREFRHHREQLKHKRDRLQEQDDLRAVRQLSDERRRYSDHVVGRTSKEVIEFAREHTPCVIILENMDGYRETADDPIHDWVRGQLQEQITYKATDEGIPVEYVNPAGTSITCRHCGQTDPFARDGTEFYCGRCDYEVHSDINGAINIAYRGLTDILDSS